MLKAIIFDFDGVICESVEVKTEAFRQLFKDYPEQLDEIIKIHVENGGISRYVKFQMVYKDIFKKELTPQISQELGDQFSQLAKDLVIQSPYVLGAYEYLKNYYDKYLMFIVSGTPEEEMLSIVEKKELVPFFKSVYGSPRSKGELTKLILEENKILPEEAVFIGDSINDYDGAKEAGVKFIGRVSPDLYNPFKKIHTDALIDDLTGLDQALQSL